VFDTRGLVGPIYETCDFHVLREVTVQAVAFSDVTPYSQADRHKRFGV
jgi:hypothetical protein